MGICKLCLKEKDLLLSHIIPRSFIKRVKGNSPQLVRMVVGENEKPRFDNANWRMPLLCAECEALINIRYEKSQIEYLRDGKIKYRQPNRITFGKFDFDRFYLFWLSILWRASVAEMDEFKGVDLGEEVNDMLRTLILSGDTRWRGLCVSSLLHIGIVKLLPSPSIDEATLAKVLTSIVVELGKEGATFYFLVEGFLVAYHLTDNPDLELPKEFGRIKKTFNLRMPALRIDESPWATKMFNKMIAKSKENAGWRIQ
ncbi:hypothetical protein QYE80_16520 [Pseudomonas tohonis]|jgi:hypothetical protein|uniref:hypothetical protein n=1 Tax=Pseudomonas solani TaxID=2731552 RepID=UPI00146EE963|nr:hypothetical protein [Pseudomonas tohonis]